MRIFLPDAPSGCLPYLTRRAVWYIYGCLYWCGCCHAYGVVNLVARRARDAVKLQPALSAR